MLRSSLTLALAGLAAVVSAQNYSTSGNLTIDPSQIEASLRNSWCRGQQIACPEICGGRATANTCNADDLTYTCTCPDNQPRNLSDYSQTLPFFVCEQWKTNCVLNHPDDRDGQEGCESVTCGSKNATEAEGGSSSSSSTMTSTATATQSSASETGASQTTGSEASSSPSSTGNAAAHLAQNYGTPVLVTALLALFGLVA